MSPHSPTSSTISTVNVHSASITTGGDDEKGCVVVPG